jgi:hypothetical protein
MTRRPSSNLRGALAGLSGRETVSPRRMLPTGSEGLYQSPPGTWPSDTGRVPGSLEAEEQSPYFVVNDGAFWTPPRRYVPGRVSP